MGALRKHTMAESYLTESDITFLAQYRLWIRASLEFQLLNVTPVADDLVWLKSTSACPYVGIGGFISLADLVLRCECSAGNKMIYEAWLTDALLKVYRAARCLDEADGDRLIAYFKSYHEIQDEADLVAEAVRAIEEVRTDLYGDFRETICT
jgi:hypothetical protein